MEEIAASKFKGTCLAVARRVRKTGRPVRITRFGAPLVDVVPTSSKKAGKRRLGRMKGTVTILGDIVAPVGKESDWEAAR